MNARWAVFALVAIACGRADTTGDSTAARAATTDVAQPWVAELGPILIVPTDNERFGVAIRPPEADTATIRLQLLRVGSWFARPVPALLEPDSVSCGDAPLVRFRAPVPAGWTVGLLHSGVETPQLDSIEGLKSADSSSFAADVARAASAVARPESRFAGLPFVVLKAYRLNQGSRTTLFANVLRRLPQEAAPLEEHLFVIAERGDDQRFAPRYSVRSEGTEDSAEHVALLAVIRAATREFAVVEREKPDHTQYEILERSVDGSWSIRWSRSC